MAGTVLDYVYVVEDLRNRTKEDVHCSRSKLYSYQSLDELALLSHVRSSDTGFGGTTTYEAR